MRPCPILNGWILNGWILNATMVSSARGRLAPKLSRTSVLAAWGGRNSGICGAAPARFAGLFCHQSNWGSAPSSLP
jgi:hypothetical protein